MMGRDGSGSGIGDALRALCEAARADGLKVPEDGFRGFHGLSEDLRLLLALLDREAQIAQGDPLSGGDAAKAVVPEPGPEMIPEEAASTPAAENMEDRRAGPDQAEPKRAAGQEAADAQELNAGAVEPSLPETAAGPDEGDPASKRETPAEPTAEEPEAATARVADDARGPAPDPEAPPAGAAQDRSDDAVAEDLAEAPQPGGVPAIPGQGGKQQGDAAVTPLEIMKKTIHLRNAKVNEPYCEGVGMAGIRGLRLLDDGGTGLRLDEATGNLDGAIAASGDFVLRLHGLLDGRRCDIIANLAVIPDPKSLWVSRDSDRTAPFWKPDEDSGMSRGDLLCVAASKRGRSHAQEGLFRDDDFRLWTGGPGGWSIAVVADGAGSAHYSRRGSQLAVSAIVKELPRLLDEHLTGQIDGLVTEWKSGVDGAEGRIRTQLYLSLATAAFRAATAISDEAALVSERASAFSTTLVVSVARKGPHGWFIAGFSIGDGGAAVFDLPSRTVVPLTLADSGEFAGQTRFLQKSEFAAGYEEVSKRIFFDVRDEFTAIFAMTDGITDPKFPTDAAFADAEAWGAFWERDLAQGVLLSRDNSDMERELLAWMDFWSPGNHDDRTLAIMLP
ncbi:PP2C family serine/threonine-protein phosphatase [Defluviimonas salinarum]|uniref:Protein phosphatase 2C domain-containing protein n=1 Tax=Defluviimonas salinarum TaxID=2992147 RepID=A0ABT3J5G2_9RHOB|nr:protein phosphatase 2C domain-containing protein [Defluviimonas salinarum]MCW3782929.1 protein phosphatase 2C domain-containing protein [Defluviimonas salinarum]